MSDAGILAPGASQRDRVVPAAELGTQENATGQAPPIGRHSGESLHAATAPGTSRRCRWASLLQRVFSIDALRCPRCGSTLRVIAAIEDPMVARKILESLQLAARAPPLDPALAGEPDLSQDDAAWHFDQTPADDEP